MGRGKNRHFWSSPTAPPDEALAMTLLLPPEAQLAGARRHRPTSNLRRSTQANGTNPSVVYNRPEHTKSHFKSSLSNSYCFYIRSICTQTGLRSNRETSGACSTSATALTSPWSPVRRSPSHNRPNPALSSAITPRPSLLIKLRQPFKAY